MSKRCAKKEQVVLKGPSRASKSIFDNVLEERFSKEFNMSKNTKSYCYSFFSTLGLKDRVYTPDFVNGNYLIEVKETFKKTPFNRDYKLLRSFIIEGLRNRFMGILIEVTWDKVNTKWIYREPPTRKWKEYND